MSRCDFRRLSGRLLHWRPLPIPFDRSGRAGFTGSWSSPGRPRREDKAPGSTLITRFWHPRDHRWSENAFESLDHALRLFVDESGWVLRQQQALDSPRAHELIFEARREDFSRPSTAQMLEEVGLSPTEVANLLDRVEHDEAS